MTNDWIPSIEECNKAYESKCDYPYSDAGIEAIRALIAERYARAAQSAPGAVSRAEVHRVKVCTRESARFFEVYEVMSDATTRTVIQIPWSDVPLPPRAEAAPRGTPAEVAVAEAAYREGLTDARDKCLELGREMGEHPEWARTCADAIDELLAAPRAPEPSPQIDSLTELETEAKPSLSECMRVAREAVERAGFVYPANPREVAREAAKAVYELFTRKHLPTCGWFQWPDGRVGQDGECKCPELRAPEPEAGDKSVETMCSLPSSLTEHVCGAMPASRKIKHYWRVECACGLETAKCSTEAMAVQVWATANPPRASEDGEGAKSDALTRELAVPMCSECDARYPEQWGHRRTCSRSPGNQPTESKERAQ